MRRLPSLLGMSLVAALAAQTGAQSFNIDYHDGAGVPSDTYGAAANQPGVWNNLSAPNGGGEPLLDLSGNPTDALAAVFRGTSRTTLFNPALSGDDAALLRDNVMTSQEDMWIEFLYLEPGIYEVYSYYLFPSPVRVWTATDPSTARWISGTWTGGFIEGQTHARHIVEIGDDENLRVNMDGDGDIFFNGLQLRRIPSPGGGAAFLVAGALLQRRRR